MLGLLREEATAMAGEMMLGHLCETAKTRLTEMNSPEGDCAFCLLPLVEDGKHVGSKQLLKLACFHCYHLCVLSQTIETSFMSYFTGQQTLHLH